MTPTEGRVARAERWWGCHCGNPQITLVQSPLTTLPGNEMGLFYNALEPTQHYLVGNIANANYVKPL